MVNIPTGVQMKIRLLFILIVFFICSGSQGEEIVSWKDAGKYINKTKTVEGVIVATYNSGKACFLNFHPDYKNNFSVVIFASDFDNFPDSPEDYYQFKTVRVTGKIKLYKGKPEIIASKQSQIKIINSAESGTSGAFASDNNLKKDEHPDTKIISWENADKYYGQYVTVRGTVIATNNTGKVCFLNFHRNWKRYFTGVIFASSFKKFSSQPENEYLNKEVEITGYIKEYLGKPEIIINDPSQIKIIK